ncbi:histidine phosphatase family protein [Clostridium sp. MB05]
MKKRLLSLCLVGVLSVLSVGCASNTDKKVEAPKETKPVEIYLTRHGKTMLNTTDRVQGWADAPLTAPGREVAEFLGAGLALENEKFVAAYASTSGRAIETAQIALEKSGQSDLQIKQDKDLREACFGDYEGEFNHKFWEDLAKANDMTLEQFMKAPDMKMMLDTASKIDPGKQAENWDQVSTRVKSAVDKIAKETEENGGGKVLVVSHGITLMTFLTQVAPESLKDLSGGLKNASVTKVLYQDGKYTVESVNDMSYVEKGKNK